MRPVIFCPKCKAITACTRHHLFPRRFFGGGNQPTIDLCPRCHRELETYIPVHIKLERVDYVRILRKFLEGDIEWLLNARSAKLFSEKVSLSRKAKSKMAKP